ncbi:MAG TPA: hypothetical protein VMN57_03275 [Anaerolineales bacterium]|nr:hypothetical protein [Anaerolineales bacterium]
MTSPIFLSNDWTGVTRAEQKAGEWHISNALEEAAVQCLAVDPHHPGRVYAGTRTHGLLRSENGGADWEPAGLEGVPVKSLAVDPTRPGVLYAGAKPVSLYASYDDTGTWQELPAMRKARRWWWFSPAELPEMTPYVQAITVSPGNPDVILAGIELGAVLRSEDGGRSWSSHLRGALRDCHSLKFHATDPDWAYEGGGSGAGVAVSRDGGRTWKQPKAGIGKKYGWMVAADPVEPDTWYLSASDMPNLLRAEFVPPAHNDGDARAHIYRSSGGGPWEKLSGGLPDPLDYMPYALVTDPQQSGHLYAGLANGEVWHTADFGDRWERLPFKLGGIHRDMVIL